MENGIREFADKLGFLIPRISRSFLKSGKIEDMGDVTFPQLIILELLKEKKACKMKEIASNFSITTSAVTGLVERMVKARLVARKADPADRRVIIVSMTERGAGILEKISRRRKEMIMNTFGKLSQGERSAYLRILEKVHAILTERRDK